MIEIVLFRSLLRNKILCLKRKFTTVEHIELHLQIVFKISNFSHSILGGKRCDGLEPQAVHQQSAAAEGRQANQTVPELVRTVLLGKQQKLLRR